jgi:hypothetical protein
MWKPGESGNPGGRPARLRALSVRISEFDEDYRVRLHEIALHGEPRDATSAIKILWGYAYGAPAQMIVGEDGKALQIDTGLGAVLQQLAARIAHK